MPTGKDPSAGACVLPGVSRPSCRLWLTELSRRWLPPQPDCAAAEWTADAQVAGATTCKCTPGVCQTLPESRDYSPKHAGKRQWLMIGDSIHGGCLNAGAPPPTHPHADRSQSRYSPRCCLMDRLLCDPKWYKSPQHPSHFQPGQRRERLVGRALSGRLDDRPLSQAG